MLVAVSAVLCMTAVVLWIASLTFRDDFSVFDARVGQTRIAISSTAYRALEVAIESDQTFDRQAVYYVLPKSGTVYMGIYAGSVAVPAPGRCFLLLCPYWIIVLATASIPAISFIRRIRSRIHRRERTQRFQCLRCGYDLRGSTDRCPECGEGIPPEQEAFRNRGGIRLARFQLREYFGIALVALVCVLWIVSYFRLLGVSFQLGSFYRFDVGFTNGSFAVAAMPPGLDASWQFYIETPFSLLDLYAKNWANAHSQMLGFGWLAAPNIRAVIIPFWFLTPMAGLACWLIFRNSKKRLRGRREQLGLCQVCGYDLRGNTSGICPECGEPLPARSVQAAST